MKVDYENRILYTRVNEIKDKYSPYHPLSFPEKYYPAHHNKNRMKKIKEELEKTKVNSISRARISSAKPHISSKALEKDYAYNLSLKQMISKAKSETLKRR